MRDKRISYVRCLGPPSIPMLPLLLACSGFVSVPAASVLHSIWGVLPTSLTRSQRPDEGTTTLLYCTVQYYTILLYTILHYTTLYYTIPYYSFNSRGPWWQPFRSVSPTSFGSLQGSAVCVCSSLFLEIARGRIPDFSSRLQKIR